MRFLVIIGVLYMGLAVAVEKEGPSEGDLARVIVNGSGQYEKSDHANLTERLKAMRALYKLTKSATKPADEGVSPFVDAVTSVVDKNNSDRDTLWYSELCEGAMNYLHDIPLDDNWGKGDQEQAQEVVRTAHCY